jgi:DNA gyrase/topoisomerase IV subunit A
LTAYRCNTYNITITLSEDEVLVVTEKGYGKRTPVSEYRLSNRGGKGIKTRHFLLEKYLSHLKLYDLVGVNYFQGIELMRHVLYYAESEDEVLVVTEKGYGKRTPVSEYRLSNRGGKGLEKYLSHLKLYDLVGVNYFQGIELMRHVLYQVKYLGLCY